MNFWWDMAWIMQRTSGICHMLQVLPSTAISTRFAA
jgi:hypothetical protein